MNIWLIILRTIIMYFVVFVVLRLMGKREIGKLSVFDLVINIMIADIAVLIIDKTNHPLYEGLAPIITLLIIQITIAFLTLKISSLRKIFDGAPSIVIANGILQRAEMKKQRYNLDDLMQQLRAQGIDNLNEVAYAILESTGQLSVFPVHKQDEFGVKDLPPAPVLHKPTTYHFASLPLPLIMDGKVLDENLQCIHKTRFWLKNQLHLYDIKQYRDVFLCSIDHRGNLFINRNE